MNSENLESLSKEELIRIIKSYDSKHEKDFLSGFKLFHFSSIIDSVYDIIFVMDKNYQIQYVNDAWKKTFPSRVSEVGKDYREYLQDIELERGNYIIDVVLNKGQILNDEFFKIYEGDQPVYFMTNFSPIKSKNNEIIGLVGIMRNYTKQHQVRKKLKENTVILEEKVQDQIKQSDELKRLRDLNEEIIANAPIGMFIVDPSGIVLSENPILCEIMVRSPNSLVGVNIIKYQGFVDSGFSSVFNKVLNTKKTVKVYEKKYVPISEKKELVINVTFDPILSNSGAVEKVLIMIEDITEHYNIRKKISRTEKMGALGILASGVAAELKGHINKMVMDLNFIDTNLDERSPSIEYIDSMKGELERIKNISEQLLSLAIIDERDKEKCDLNKIVTNHPVDVFINRIKNDGINVELILPEISPEVLATPSQIQQLFIQFLENAEDALTDNGKITINIESVRPDKNSYVVITLTDNGMGIPKENIGKVFQPFFTTKGKKGTGLGLMIATSIVGNIGGSIGVKSNTGEGTSIRVVLPQIN
ncbi:MAG: ATP-binding protein [Leptospirales bacterium]|nr:ATP-binding protein [Leptospirales bacterium]